MKLALRMFAEGVDARGLAARVCAELPGARVHTIAPSPTDPRLLEIVLHVDADCVEDVTSALGSGWDPQADGGAILIHRERAWFMEESVRWARVEVLG